MVAASVGFQCPDDVRAGQAGARQPRTAVGGTLGGGVPRVTGVLIGLNVAIYLLGLAGGDLALRYGNLGLAVAQGEYYRLLTAAFLHANLFHLLSNMFALITVGPQLEAVLGRVRYLVLYVLAAVGGSTLSFLVAPPQTLGVGASGAVFGLFGAFYVVARRFGGDTRSIVAVLAINLVITFALPIIDWRAHVGGLVVGAIVAAAYAYAPAGPRRGLVQGGACVGVAAALVVAVLLRAAALQGS